MIIKLKKLLIYGLEKELSQFFEKAQIEGYIEFIGSSSKKIRELPSSLNNYVEAIKVLKQQPTVKIDLENIKYSADEACDKIIQASNNIEHLEELEVQLNEQAAVVAPIGDFSLNDLEYIKNETNHIFQFFTIKSSKQMKKEEYEDLIFIGKEYDLDYFVAINKEKKVYQGYMELNVEIPIGVINKRLSMIEKQIHSQREKLKSFAPYISMLNDRLIGKFNYYNLEVAKQETNKALDESLFSVEAWVPCNKMGDFERFIKNYLLDYSIVSIEEKDREPTYMENKKLGMIGEDLVKIYDMPSTDDKDPSLWVLWSFTIFFAMIVGDGGYGVIYLVLALFLRYKIKKPVPRMKRFIKLVFMLSISCIIWGAATASFFGINFKPNSNIQKFSLLSNLSEKKSRLSSI